MVRHDFQMMPEEFQHVVHLIQADARLTLFQVANKPQANSHSFGKFHLSESCPLAQFLDVLAEWSYAINYISYQV